MNNNWEDHGIIIDLNEINKHNSTNFAWAQGPQVLKFGDFYRVYFSSRSLDRELLPISNVYYVDFPFGFNNRHGEVTKVKIEPGVLGGFDQHGIFPFHPYIVEDKYIVALTSGWKRMGNVDIDMSIGQAISLDGRHFARNGYGPIISAGPNEPFLIGDPFVMKLSRHYFLFYIFGTKWTKCISRPERTYKIGRMISKNGLDFERINSGEQIIPDTIDDEAQAMPSVVKIQNLYHMFYCYRSTFDFRLGGPNSYKLGHAISKDCKNWKLDHSILPSTFPPWSQYMQCYPFATLIDNLVHIFYNGNDFGKQGIGLMTKDIGAFNDS
jgi:hypothetical protein